MVSGIKAMSYVLLEKEFNDKDIDHVCVYDMRKFDEIVTWYQKNFGQYMITGKSKFMKENV